jgi:hypothetical protein
MKGGIMKRDVWAGHDFDAMAATAIVWIVFGLIALGWVWTHKVC